LTPLIMFSSFKSKFSGTGLTITAGIFWATWYKFKKMGR